MMVGRVGINRVVFRYNRKAIGVLLIRRRMVAGVEFVCFRSISKGWVDFVGVGVNLCYISRF